MINDVTGADPASTTHQTAHPGVPVVIVAPESHSVGPRAEEPLRFKFVQLQVSYYMTQMTIGDTKAAGILAFLVAVSGVTADRLGGAGVSFEGLAAGLLAVGLSVVGGAFAFGVIWPRLTGSGRPGNVFSWVSTSSTPKDEHIRLLNKAREEQLINDVAESMLDIAIIIREKYAGVQRALLALIPATGLHVLSWFLT